MAADVKIDTVSEGKCVAYSGDSGCESAFSARSVHPGGRAQWSVLAAGVSLACLLVLLLLVLQSRRADKPLPRLPQQKDFFAEIEGEAYSEEAASKDRKNAAIGVSEELATQYPDDPAAVALRARVHFVLGETEEAVQIWQECLRRDATFPNATFGLGLVAFKSEDYETAAEMFGRIMQIDPADDRAPRYRAEALLKLNRCDESALVMEAYLRTHQPTVESALILGQAYLKLERFDESRQVFTIIAKESPEEPRGHYGLARVCLKLGRKEEARRHLERFKARDKEKIFEGIRFARGNIGPITAQGLLVVTLLDSGKIYLKHGEPARADDLWRKAALVDPENAESRHCLFSLCSQQGNDQSAFLVCEQLREIEPENAEHWLNLAILYGRFDRYVAAVDAVEHAVQLDPENPRYRQVREMIRQGQ